MTVAEQIIELAREYRKRFGKQPGRVVICEAYHGRLVEEMKWLTRTTDSEISRVAGIDLEVLPGRWIGMEAVEHAIERRVKKNANTKR